MSRIYKGTETLWRKKETGHRLAHERNGHGQVLLPFVGWWRLVLQQASFSRVSACGPFVQISQRDKPYQRPRHQSPPRFHGVEFTVFLS